MVVITRRMVIRRIAFRVMHYVYYYDGVGDAVSVGGLFFHDMQYVQFGPDITVQHSVQPLSRGNLQFLRCCLNRPRACERAVGPPKSEKLTTMNVVSTAEHERKIVVP